MANVTKYKYKINVKHGSLTMNKHDLDIYVCISHLLFPFPDGSTLVFILQLQNANGFQVVLMPLVEGFH